jgi:hypothetical protein
MNVQGVYAAVLIPRLPDGGLNERGFRAILEFLRGQGLTKIVVNGATGERRAVVTDSDGGYRFPNLLPGNYKIEVSQVGFKLYLRDHVTVQVESSVRIDVAMEVGDVTQQIEVSAAAPLLQTENASLSQVVGTRSVQELPLNGRNILNLVNLVPGVVPQGSSDGNLTGKNDPLPPGTESDVVKAEPKRQPADRREVSDHSALGPAISPPGQKMSSASCRLGQSRFFGPRSVFKT